VGLSIRWGEGQFCTILTEVGVVGCGIYDMAIATEFSKAVAIARPTPQQRLDTPEDLLDAVIAEVTPQAQTMGIAVGMTGREAVELFLAAAPKRSTTV